MPTRKLSFWSSRSRHRSPELITHRPWLLSSPSAVSWVVVALMLFDVSAPPRSSADTFLPDDAVIACRAILPQCFQRAEWAVLCADDASVAAGHPEACREAGFQPDQPPQGR